MLDGDIIRKPTDVLEVAEMLGVNTFDLGTLCSHKNVNMWARYKPVVYPALDADISKAEVHGAKYSGYQGIKVPKEAVDGDFGVVLACDTAKLKEKYPSLTIGTTGVGNGKIYLRKGSSYAEYRYLAMQALYECYKWQRIPPFGTEYSPYRLNDFDGYNHYAPMPFFLESQCFNVTVNMASANKIVPLYFGAQEANDDDTCIGIEDFAKFGNIDFRKAKVAYVGTYQGRYFFYESDYIMSERVGDINYISYFPIDISDYPIGLVNAPFYVAIEQLDDAGNGWLLPVLSYGKSFPASITTSYDMAEQGAGIKDWKTDVWFCVSSYSDFGNDRYSALAYNLLEEGDPTKYIVTTSGVLFIKIKFYNGSSTSKTWSRTAVTITTEVVTNRYAGSMIVDGKSAQSVTIPAKGTKEVIFCYDGVRVLPDYKDIGNNYVGSEITILFNNVIFFSGTLYHHSGYSNYIANL